MELLISGNNYQGVKSGSVTCSISSIANSFNATLNNFSKQQISSIKAGLPLSIKFEGELVLTGYIDAVSPSYDNRETSISIKGRSKAGDLVDCTLPEIGTEWKKKNVIQIANIWGSSFGISFTGESGSLIETINYEYGTEVFEALKKHTEKEGLIVYSLPNGNCLISVTNIGSSGLSFIEGQNIISFGGDIDLSNVFSSYIVKGSAQSNLQQSEEEASNAPNAVLNNKMRNRPLVIIADGNADIGVCKKRAEFEEKIRIGQSESYTVAVQGWLSTTNLNKTAIMDLSNSFGIKKTMLISGMTLSVSEDGSTTEVTLANTEAFVTDQTKKTLDKNPYTLQEFLELLNR